MRGFAALETPPAFLPTVGNNPGMAITITAAAAI